MKKNHNKRIYNFAIFICFILIADIFLSGCVTEEIEPYQKKLTCEILDESLELGTQFLINNQKPEGNFNYEYNWSNKSMSLDDNEVRQAGVLWGVALIYNENPSDTLFNVLKKGFSFFKNYSTESEDGRRWVIYPDDDMGNTGTVALLSLAIIDFLRSSGNIDAEYREELENDLDKYLNFLISVRLENFLFHETYYLKNGTGYGNPSPYFDGESLLALTKAAKYLDKDELKPIILETANATYHYIVEPELYYKTDSPITKGFFQWGCMSYFELATSDWEETENYSDILIDLADWMIDVHHTLKRTRNTGYAYEGIIHAYKIALDAGDEDHIEKFTSVIDEGLYKLTSWQVEGPIPNAYLHNHSTNDTLAIGGIMNHKEEPPLRIDVTQHQMHAVILARKYVYGC